MVSPKASRAIPTLPHTSHLGWHLCSVLKSAFEAMLSKVQGLVGLRLSHSLFASPTPHTTQQRDFPQGISSTWPGPGPGPCPAQLSSTSTSPLETNLHLPHNTTHISKPNSSNTKHTMASRYSSSKPVVHQAPASISSAYSASTGSYASSRGYSTPRSISPSDEAYLRVYGADQHRAAIKENSGVTIINRKQSGYDAHAPSPHYGGGYSRH
ncbi:hypothetical protein CFIO01_12933 [Colletotrichum fioriniae PJ7]|uniref:Uncharacterized protein n=1 Tax=Colletotrichum fioriniae PJ7 TaxID=1445577 RepID=A0A010RMS8_9PEZI|nr:hypothetical protein CFIO01_12933 [Colletotrichum fioriniae PJ7]